jgi:uncharacterized protein YndB with AHSA1/START domain
MSDENSSETRRQQLVIERTYRASLEEIWNLWTTKQGFESWWGPEGFRVEVHRLEARVGGALEYDMIAAAPEQIAAMKQMGRPISHQTRGTFTELAPHERLTVTHVIDFLPGVKPYDSSIRVQLVPVDDSVRMVVTLDAMHNDEFTKMSLEGFTSQLTKLDKRFAAGQR